MSHNELANENQWNGISLFLPMKFDEVGNSCEAIFSDKE